MSDWDKFTKKKSEVKKLLNQAREEFVKDKLIQDRNDPKKFWRSINRLTVFEMLKTTFKSWNDQKFQTCVFIDFLPCFRLYRSSNYVV